MTANFYIVWNPSGALPPSVRHGTLQAAEAEAVRLATEHVGAQFFVLAARCFAQALRPLAHITQLYDAAEFDELDFIDTPPDPDRVELDRLVPRHPQQLKGGEFQTGFWTGDRVRYVGRRDGSVKRIGRTGVVASVCGGEYPLLVRLDGDQFAGRYLAENFEHETRKTFHVGDRVKVVPKGLVNVPAAGGFEADILFVHAEADQYCHPYRLQFDNPVPHGLSEEASREWSARDEDIDLVLPVQARR